MDRQSLSNMQRGRPVSGLEAAHANEHFDPFLNATTLKSILGHYRAICEYLHLKPTVFPHFYPKLRANLTSWRAKALLKKFDLRASHKCYGKGKICSNSRVLIIGAGPCGMRTAIECQLLGAKVVVIEKRDRLSRNNVLHLWPFVIEDLRALGAKKFFGKFCAGAIDHISIRQLQCILLKVALLLGVEVHTEVSFENLIEPDPNEKTGWRAEFQPADHPVSQYEFDVIMGADGKRNTLQGFKRKEFRGKLAIAITANFINKKTEAEARVEEISGVAFIFNQKFFKDLYEETKIDLENIVYYKDETHYFVMTAKKASLFEKGVIKQDSPDTEKLLAQDNVDRDALQEYAREAANFSTNYIMPDLEFAVNHYGQPDVAMFDFTSMYAAENSSTVVEKNGHPLLMLLVGDSLLEPFWPTGSGCARGFLSSMDAAWALRSWCLPNITALEVLAERESIYRLLAQTTPDNLNKDCKSYTLDPATRYPNLNKNVVLPMQTICLYHTDNPKSIEKMTRRGSIDIVQPPEPKKRRRVSVDNDVLLSWISEQIKEHEDVQVPDIESIFKDGRVLCAIIHHYRPDLLDYNAIKNDDPVKNNQLAFDILERDLGIPPIMTGEEITNTEDFLTMASYLTQVYDTFRGEIPHIKHPKLSKKHQESQPTVKKKRRHLTKRQYNVLKFLSRKNMSEAHHDTSLPPDQIYNRVSKWISAHDFRVKDDKLIIDKESVITEDMNTDLTSITKCIQKKGLYDDIKVEERTAEVTCKETPVTSEENFTEMVKNRSNGGVINLSTNPYSPLKKCNIRVPQAPSKHFSIIVEGEESELPEGPSKRTNEFNLKNFKPVDKENIAQHRPSSRQKRHAEVLAPSKSSSFDRKSRKQRRTLEKVGASVVERQKVLEDIVSNRNDRQNKRRQQRKLQTEQFLKSMQMLQANAKSDHSQPFEDYSLFVYRQTAANFEDRVKDLEKKFTYVPDHDKASNAGLTRGGQDEDLQARIKSLEDKWKDPQPIEKKPKDLLRAIGKIETSDWNIKEIEKKIRENKLGKNVNKDKERVPKWSKEEFIARQTKMESKHLDRQDSGDPKYKDFDKNIRSLAIKLKEGTVRQLGTNKVAAITEKLVSKKPADPKPIEKNPSKTPVMLPTQGGSEYCHFCSKRVYLMERLSAEQRFFHHGCFKCQYCHTQLRLGSYSFDRDGEFGYKFFCTHHYGMLGELPRQKVTRKPSQRNSTKLADKKRMDGVDLLESEAVNQTPERIDFMSDDHEETMDEDEWTDKNFGASCAEIDDSDDDSYSYSDSDSDDEDAYDDAMEEPATKEGTMKWAERFKKRYYRKRNESESEESSLDSSYENTTDDDESDTATEGEEEIRARELRKQEVRVEPPVIQTDTGTDTEVVSDESSESSSEVQNSATEISTDSEFAQDDPTPTREVPAIMLNDFNVTKTRGSHNYKKNQVTKTRDTHNKFGTPKKIQVTSGVLPKPMNGKAPQPDIQLNLKPLVSSTPIKKPAPILLPRTEGYALNRTQSTGGIAAKVSLELKKRYLLGEVNHPGSIQKSGSASTLDTKFKSFHTNISDCQKLLKPAAEISASMQTFCNKLDERVSPVLSPSSSQTFVRQLEKSDTQIYIAPKTDVQESKESPEKPFENVLEGRPRSPVHETSIIVPEIDWSKKNRSHSEDSLSSSSSENNLANSPNYHFKNIPTFEVHTIIEDDMPPDSLMVTEVKKSEIVSDNHSSLNSEPPKSISSEKKSLNQPKSLPHLQRMLPEIHNSLHTKKIEEEIKTKEITTELDIKSSGRSTPDSCAEQVTAALTETELSDWARDEEVSDDLDFELSQEDERIKDKKPIVPPEGVKIATIAEFDDLGHICGKDREMDKTILTPALATTLSGNLDNIEFMDTETSSDDGIVDSQNGYVLFRNEDELNEDSLNPNINEINAAEARNEYVNGKDAFKNTGYCIIDREDKFGSEVIDLKPADLEKLKQNQSLTSNEEDSLLILDTASTTTEENTCSDSTVKNITEIPLLKEKSIFENNNFQKKRLEEKLAKVKAEQALIKQNNEQRKESSPKDGKPEGNLEFDEHCQRLQSKVEFGNARDSIDIRKSRRKSKTELPPKPDLIQEEKSSPLHSHKPITLSLSPAIRTPDNLYKKENIMKERDVNQKLIQEMVMNKMKAENKSLERKKRSRNGSSPIANKPYEIMKSATTNVSLSDLDKKIVNSTPDVLLNTNLLQKSKTINTVPEINNSPEKYSAAISTIKESRTRPLSVYSTFAERKLAEIKSKLPESPLSNSENCSLPDIRKNINNDDFKTPKAPPRLKYDDTNRTAEKMRQDARARVRLLSNEDLGLSPEDKLIKLREKAAKRGKENTNRDIAESIESLVVNTERRNSWLYSNDSLNKKRNNSFRRSKSGECTTHNSNPKLSAYKGSTDYSNRTKSISEINKNADIQKNNDKNIKNNKKICKSDPNLLDTEVLKPVKKSKDRERRKSISKILTTLFAKKSPNSGSKSIFSRMSPKTKDISKSCTNLELKDVDVLIEEPIRRKSYSELSIQNKVNEIRPPPIPPLPLNYTGKATDESSDGEHDWRKRDQSSCDTLDQSGFLDNSMTSLSGRRSGKARKMSRQAQLKRHRMAQEIQRKLEETEVKTRELEKRGVYVEKALRGEETEGCSKEESDLLQEWFDLMRDRTELRRYEKELMVRAQELELEDRHARLQHELRDRLETDAKKTDEDVKLEESIISEMMDIVSKRDSIIATMEEDRLRYSNEDRDLEEQMLAKGLRLTPIRKTPEK